MHIWSLGLFEDVSLSCYHKLWLLKCLQFFESPFVSISIVKHLLFHKEYMEQIIFYSDEEQKWDH